MPRIIARQEYWKTYPPTHILVRLIAMWAGAYKPPPDETKARKMSLAELHAMFPNGISG